MLAEVEKMPEERICSFSGDKIEPGSVLWFKDSKSRKNHIKTKRNPRRVKWTRFYVKGGIK